MGRYISCASGAGAACLFRCTLDVIGSCCCQWSTPYGITTVTFEIWGGGGAGGPPPVNVCSSTGAGSGGGYSLITITPIGNYTICAGGGGTALSCAVACTSLGCPGCTSFVTGCGLTNFCATGGNGGGNCQYGGGACNGACTCNGGIACGGNVNINGGYSWNYQISPSYCGLSMGGPAPFGGGLSYYQAGTNGYANCGSPGMFPGGGGTGMGQCCCLSVGNCCPGSGAPGLVRITF